ncbi:hypothetical protein OG349_07750 [Streptomyces sp. NBC_01317]|uniref:hypothetical protein n=1 Tax=Streptomyces sp. NBC_01317 TaxID=2903822 RepID=UPI002E0D8DB7|nr:hypothetical protein OG349_07750 [Streptomyces sp. NBC_01317]
MVEEAALQLVSRVSGLAWISNSRGRVLTVLGEQGPRLPGGPVGDRQSDVAAVLDHVSYGTGLSVALVRLLGINWERTGAGMSQSLVYLCRAADPSALVRTPDAGAQQSHPPAFRWLTLGEARREMSPARLHVFEALWAAWRDETTAVLHHGRPAFDAAGVQASSWPS